MFLAVLAFAALFILKGAAAKVGSDSGSKKTLGYRQKKTLFTAAERSFLGVLDQCVDPSQYRVFGKIRVADLIEPTPSKNRSEWQKAFNPIKAKHFDYVICNSDTLKPVCAIELDDKSHSQKKRQQRDHLLENVCEAANLSLIRVPAKRSYKLEEVKVLLAKHFVSDTAVERSVSRAVAPTNGQDVESKVEGIHVSGDEIGGAVR